MGGCGVGIWRLVELLLFRCLFLLVFFTSISEFLSCLPFSGEVSSLSPLSRLLLFTSLFWFLFLLLTSFVVDSGFLVCFLSSGIVSSSRLLSSLTSFVDWSELPSCFSSCPFPFGGGSSLSCSQLSLLLPPSLFGRFAVLMFCSSLANLFSISCSFFCMIFILFSSNSTLFFNC